MNERQTDNKLRHYPFLNRKANPFKNNFHSLGRHIRTK
jgi:hypothetical protein